MNSREPSTITQVAQISVCICTFRRPNLLRRLLTRLQQQRTDGKFNYCVVVVDNDAAQSAREVVAEYPPIGGSPIIYCVEPHRNIASARNRLVHNAPSDWIAFIDDDEVPDDDWISQLLETCIAYDVMGVLGPVKPYFDHEPPEWAIKGRFFERPTHPTGYVLNWSETRTGNVLFRRSIIAPETEPFRVEFGVGGSDMDFFRRAMDRGHQFIWCNEAVVHELVPPSRCNRSYLLRRALLRGSNYYKHPTDRMTNLLKSLIAVPCYTLALPVLLLFGQHWFLKYLVKLVDHGSRLLGFVGVRIVTQREF